MVGCFDPWPCSFWEPGLSCVSLSELTSLLAAISSSISTSLSLSMLFSVLLRISLFSFPSASATTCPIASAAFSIHSLGMAKLNWLFSSRVCSWRFLLSRFNPARLDGVTIWMPADTVGRLIWALCWLWYFASTNSPLPTLFCCSSWLSCTAEKVRFGTYTTPRSECKRLKWVAPCVW